MLNISLVILICASVGGVFDSIGERTQQQGAEAQGAQPRVATSRDSTPSPAGTARIRGRVTAADTGAPLRHAQLQLSSPQTGSQTGTTDADGRFEFGRLAAGQYTLTATKIGYLRAQYGQRGPLAALNSGAPIDLGGSQKVDGADIQLVRGGVVTGSLVDEFGDPIPDASVQALRYQFVNGQRQLVRAGRVAQTNDIGEFRLFGLLPGKYHIFAMAQASTAALGQFGGSGASMAPRGTRPGLDSVSPPDDASSGYAPTYYPGTANVADAQVVTIGAG